MKKNPRKIRREPGLGALDLIEEATHVVRAASPGTLACYYAGALPFVLAFVYFWQDMSEGALAREHDAEAALVMALAYLWMKCWHNIFARRIHAQISLTEAEPWTFARCRRVLASQAMLQPWGLILLTPPILVVWIESGSANGVSQLYSISTLFIMLFWCFVSVMIFAVPVAFFQNLTALDEGDDTPAWELVKRAGRLAGLWQKQNLIALLVLALFALFVFINWLSFFYLLPQLMHTLLGIDSAFTRLGIMGLLNSTFLAANVGLTFLCMDPLLKTMYVLRCFYGESRHSGEDLKARLKRAILDAKSVMAVLCVILLLLAGMNRLSAADAPAPAAPPPASSAPASPAPTSVAPDDLDQSINNVMQQGKYAVRIPGQDSPDDAAEGFLSRFIDHVQQMLAEWRKAILDWLGKIIRDLFPSQNPLDGGVGGSSIFAGISLTWVLIFTLGAFVVCALAVFIYRYIRSIRRKSPLMLAQPLAATPDLADENVGAEARPEDGWTKLARELLERGEYRLALRAFYLAALAHLASRNLISLAKFKSNRDYERELRRRGHAFPQVPPTFAEMVATFERVWYGWHQANPDLVNGFNAQADKLRRAE